MRADSWERGPVFYGANQTTPRRQQQGLDVCIQLAKQSALCCLNAHQEARGRQGPGPAWEAEQPALPAQWFAHVTASLTWKQTWLSPRGAEQVTAD